MCARAQSTLAVLMLFAGSMALSVFAETGVSVSVQKGRDVPSRDADMPGVDGGGRAAAWASLLPTDLSSESAASDIPGCDQADTRRIGVDVERQTAYLRFGDAGLGDTRRPEYSSNQLAPGNALAFGNQLASDTVNANFSNLGTNMALRGRSCTTQFGSTKVTTAVGVFADDWASLATGQPATPVRDAAAAKVEHELDDSVKTFFTAQGYQYDQRGLQAGLPAGQLGRAQSVTAGLDYRKGRFGLVGEVGGSRRDDGLQSEEDSSAAALDGSWQALDNVTFRLGHHDFGRSYTTLSGYAAPGLTETYTGAKWKTTPWLSIDTDLRRSLNRLATDAVARDAVSVLTSATIAIPQLTGWGFNLQALQSNGDNADGSNNDSTNYGAGVRYAAKSWQTGFGITQGFFDNARMAGNGTSAGFNYDVAVFWNDVMASVPPNWNARFTFGTAYQHQEFESGLSGRNSNANVGVALQHQQWGMFSAAIARGRTEQMAGPNVDSQSYQSEYSKPLSRNHSLKFYYRQTRTVDYSNASELRDQSGGLQFVMAQ